MIVYKNNIDGISAGMLSGFFSGWKEFPSSDKLLSLLNNSQHVVIAFDEEKNIVAGFINAISDKVLSAYIPLIEVLEGYRKKGIGSELAGRMMNELKDYYMIDLVCDEHLENFYNKFGLKKHTAMIRRNYNNQKGK